MSAPTLVFDLETIPDVAALRLLHELPDALPDEEVVEYAAQRQRARSGSDFLPHHLQRIVTLAGVWDNGHDVKVFSLAAPELDEAEILRQFFAAIDKKRPQLVTWNGGGFDLPVLHYRSLLHGVQASAYWEVGERESEYRYNNYLGRFHWRHLDLMDVLAGYQTRAAAPLDQIARLLGFPGKLGMDGGQVWGAWCRGEAAAIRAYCETDAVNTHLVFLRFQWLRGKLDERELKSALDRLREHLEKLPGAHWREFLAQCPLTAADPKI
ncbi:MAG: 3'-5' exonuclease [Tepidiphilus sp.]|jgi:predicted PolB exonuclease-like 3'-5' exonuclease|nr:3'-5' exonuclease [Tepidiphilus sp.]